MVANEAGSGVSRGAVIVTGASRGIGRAIAARLARDGWPLALVARDEAKLAAVAAEIGGGTAEVRTYTADIVDASRVEEVVQQASSDLGEIHGLVNNAGITRDALLVRMKPEDWQSVIDTNLNGTFYFTRAVAPLMMRRREGRIVSISSVIGMSGNAGQVNYAASKAGIVALTKSVARELGGRHVTANVVAPGYVTTDMTASLPDKVKEDMLRRIPLRRFGDGDDVAGAVSFLLSPDAAYITGQVLVVDGGMMA
ncbi:MAG: 3-oxoacyl-[acyl-carrier-protein] reductase [Candidatus Krumholzibacteriia bacterium]